MRSLVLFLCLSLTATAAETCTALNEAESIVLSETNSARARIGLPGLVVDCRLMAAARRHARRLAQSGSLYHSQGVAENVASGQPDGFDAVASWMASSGHRANILNRSHRRVGVAGFVGPDGRHYWVQQFAP